MRRKSAGLANKNPACHKRGISGTNTDAENNTLNYDAGMTSL